MRARAGRAHLLPLVRESFIDPVLVADRILMGPYLIVHDDTKMARQTTIAGLGIKRATEYQGSR